MIVLPIVIAHHLSSESMETGKSYSISSLIFSFFYTKSFPEAFNSQKIYLGGF